MSGVAMGVAASRRLQKTCLGIHEKFQPSTHLKVVPEASKKAKFKIKQSLLSQTVLALVRTRKTKEKEEEGLNKLEDMEWMKKT